MDEREGPMDGSKAGPSGAPPAYNPQVRSATVMLLVFVVLLAVTGAAWAHSPQGIKVVGEITAWDAQAQRFTVKDSAGTLWTFSWDAETHFTGPGPGAPGKRVTVRWWHEREHRDVLRATDVKFVDQSTR